MTLISIYVCRKVLSVTIVVLFLVDTFLFLTTVQPVAAASTLKLKWSRNLGELARTYIGPLAANLVGDDRLEVVIVGGSKDGGTDGTVTVLNGTTGNVIWQVSPANNGSVYKGIGSHTPFEIADLNKDGIPEIIIAAADGVLALHGNNGSVYWKNTAVHSGESYIAVADIDGDGYPEVFVNRGNAITDGYDWITCLSYNGSILHQAWSWRPCWGGLTVCDTDFDGRFELYQGDRSNSYNDPGDKYKGGGMGVRALDAHTLTPLWNDPTILCSTHIPMLGDVDKDGILDVIVADQGTSGIAVLNSADGSVVTTGGKYRKSGTQMPAHSQPTVYDIDGDGNLEIISCYKSAPKIWDLYDWKLDATLNVSCFEPPKVGDVTGDGFMDIIAVTGNDIYVYDKNYSLVESIIDAPTSEASAFTLVQDVDGDGLNELVVTGSSGILICYDTPASSPTPRARSVNQFYSERRCGAAEYVPPPIPSKPVLRDEQPLDGSLNHNLNPTLYILATDFQGDLMNITFKTNASGTWQGIGNYYNVPNGVYSATTTNMSSYGTTYYWSVSATDAITGNWTYKIYSFTTYSNPPTQGNPILVSSGGKNGTEANLICYNQTTTDIDGDRVTNIYNWYVNNTSLTNLYLPFDTRSTKNPLVADELFSDGFENGFEKWNENGVTNWDLDTSQKRSGLHSAHANSTATYLISDNIDTSSAEGITVSFRYRDHGIDDDDDVYLQFWNGSTYINIFELGNTSPEDAWHWYTVQTYDPRYLIADFRVRFEATGIDSSEDLWIDDFSITTPSRTKDYSGYNNHATIHGATWTSEGVGGGAYVFDGSNDYIRISDGPSLGGDGSWSEISIEFWIKPAALQRGARIITKEVASASTGSYMIGFNTSGPANTLFWGINSTSDWAWHEVNSTMVLEVGKWYHVVCTYKSGLGLTIYVNGTEQASMPLTGNIACSPGVSIYNAPLFIGYDGGGDQRRWLKGTLDEVRIYTRALSPFQILQYYLETKDGISNSSTISWQETKVGEVWKCQVTPNDSFGDGGSRFSNTWPPTVQFELIIGVVGNGTTSPVQGTYLYNEGTNVTVTAIPDSGWMLIHWLLNDTDVGSDNPYNVTMNGNWNLTAVFAETPPELFEDGFESGNFSAWTGTVTSSGENATVVDALRHHGNYSAMFTSNGNGGFEGAYCYRSISPQSELYARGYVYVSKSGIADNDDRFYFIRFRAGVNDVAYAGWRQVRGVVRWSLIIRDGTGWVTAYSDWSPSLNQWYCVELHWVESNTSGYGELYVNGVLVCSIQGRNTAAFGHVDLVRFGLAELYNCNSTIIYCDCCAVSKAYIGQEYLLTTLHLESKETVASSNLGSITFDSISYSLPYDVSKGTGIYSAGYIADAGYMFDQWETTGLVSVSNANANPTEVTVSGNGTLRAIYKVYTPVLFEDGFESGNFSAWTGTVTSSGENATAVSTLSHHGNYSAMFASNGDGGFEGAYSYVAVQPSSELYARGYFYVNHSGIVNNDNRFYFIIIRAGSNNVAYAGWRQVGGAVKWSLIIRDGTGWATAYSVSSPQLNRWYCVELHWKKDAANGLGELWVDDTMVCSIIGKNTTAFSSADTVRFGLAELYNCNSTIIYGDCFVASKAYIGLEVVPANVHLESVEDTGYSSNLGSITFNGASYSLADDQVRFGLAELYNCASTTIYCDCCNISKEYIGQEP